MMIPKNIQQFKSKEKVICFFDETQHFQQQNGTADCKSPSKQSTKLIPSTKQDKLKVVKLGSAFISTWNFQKQEVSSTATMTTTIQQRSVVSKSQQQQMNGSKISKDYSMRRTLLQHSSLQKVQIHQLLCHTNAQSAEISHSRTPSPVLHEPEPTSDSIMREFEYALLLNSQSCK